MTERRKLKKELSKLKSYAKNLPRLIDCSGVYGDTYYSEQDLKDTQIQISALEERIAKIPVTP